MYTVQIERECDCFKKSEYASSQEFATQKEAYAYASLVAEWMNEEFCGRDSFCVHRGEGEYFLIGVAPNPEALGITPHISCDRGCSATDVWSLESKKRKE
jgi:hypothetical protein